MNWPTEPNDAVTWLVTRTHGERFIDNIFAELCRRLRQQGVPVARGTLYFDINHPQWAGARMLWTAENDAVDITTIDYGIETSSRYLNSPIQAIHAGAPWVRRRLDTEDIAEPWYPIFSDLREQGMTDYVAWPIEHTLGKRHHTSFASDAPGGFSEHHLQVLRDLMPALALVSEIRVKNRMARTLLETYVGPHAGEQILAGQVRRGSGSTLSAAILICDLRDFTSLSDEWPRDDVIDLLNRYFDAVADPIDEQGGEILKFMGDGMLAVFPLDDGTAFDRLLKAVEGIRRNMATIEVTRNGDGPSPLRYGIGVHVGDVMYGNIGSRRRLDFTVIGPAVNIASRIEALTKRVGHPVLVSSDFVRRAGCDDRMERVGVFPLPGVHDPVEVFTPR
jgi:adenylate cyclase